MKKAICLLAVLCALCFTAFAAEGEWIYQEETEIGWGKLCWFSDEILRETAPKGKTTWQSTNPAAATVDKWGNVQAAKPDSLQQTFIIAERDGVSYTWKVTVRPLSEQILLYAGGELLESRTLDLDAGQNSLSLHAVVLPEGAPQEVEYILKEKGASIDENGLFSVEEDGRYTIGVRAKDRGRASVQATVTALHPIRALELSGDKQIASGQSFPVQVGFVPENATIQSLVWTSSDESIAIVDENGVVTGMPVEQISQVQITAAAADGSGVFSVWPVTVVPSAQRIDLTLDGEPFAPKAIILDDSAVGSILEFGAEVYPAAAAQEVRWTSGNNGIIKADSSGRLGVVGRGTCRLTVEALDGSGLRRVIDVSVGDIDKLPYYLEIDKGNQVVRVFEKDDRGMYTVLSRRMVCSTGVYDRAYADGLYDVDSARHAWMGTIIEGVNCQYGVRIFDQIWFHSLPYSGTNASRMDMDAYAELGTRASHGCIRLLCADAKWIHDNVRGGSWIAAGVWERVPEEYAAVSWPEAQGGWDPTDPNEKNPYFDASYTSEVAKP